MRNGLDWIIIGTAQPQPQHYTVTLYQTNLSSNIEELSRTRQRTHQSIVTFSSGCLWLQELNHFNTYFPNPPAWPETAHVSHEMPPQVSAVAPSLYDLCMRCNRTT